MKRRQGKEGMCWVGSAFELESGGVLEIIIKDRDIDEGGRQHRDK